MNQNDELYHYGIPGMRWGRRKSGYITYRQASKNAKSAGDKAAKESLAKDKQTLKGIGSGRKALKNANAARKQAMKESIARDKAKNKEYKQTDEYKKSRNKKIAIGTAVVGTTLATYGAYKLHQKHVKEKAERTKKIVDGIIKLGSKAMASDARMGNFLQFEWTQQDIENLIKMVKQ